MRNRNFAIALALGVVAAVAAIDDLPCGGKQPGPQPATRRAEKIAAAEAKRARKAARRLARKEQRA